MVAPQKGEGAQNGTGDSGSGGDEEMEEEAKHVVRALYAFAGSNDDEVSKGAESVKGWGLNNYR